jgi:hypothetical protein
MTYHLGNNPPAASLAAPRTYGYFKFVDESSYEPWRGVPDMDVLPEPRDIRGLGSPLFFKIVDSGGPVVTVTMMGRKNNVTNQVIRSVDASMTEKVRRFLAAIPRTIPTFTEEEVLATTRPLRISAPQASKPGASSSALSYNTRIALGIGAGALLLLVGLGVTLGGRKRAGMQPNRKRTSRSRGMRPNDRRWEMQQYYQSQHGAERRRAIQKQAREDAALRMWGELTAPVTDSRGAVHMPSPDDRMAAIELVRQAYPDVDLWWLPRVKPNRSVFPNSRWKSSPGKHKYYNRTAIQDYFLRTATDAGKARLEIAESERENRPADLSHARLRSIDLSGAYLVAADLRGTDLSHADLSGANLSYANLEGANLRSANLTGAMLKEANLTRANLKDAELVSADLTNADLTDAYLYGADTTGAVMQPNRSTVYAIPERKAYPITTSMDAYHATQRLKQGRVKSESEARRIVAAIKREHHDIWTKYLKDYPVSRIMTSKRKGLAARRRA